MSAAYSRRRRWRIASAHAKRLAKSRGGVFLLCLIFTLVMVYHYVIPLSAILFTEGIAAQDCGQMIWNLWHVNESISAGRNPYSTNLVFYPVGADLSHHTLAAGFFPVTFFVKKLSGDDPMHPIYAYRIIVWLSFTLILYGSYLFLRELNITRWASVIAAVAYGFCDFYMLHAYHINHLAGFFIPFTALCLVRSYKRPTTLNILMVALVSACAIYFTEFTLFIYMSLCLSTLLLWLLPEERNTLMEKLRVAGFRRIAPSLLVLLIIVFPFIVNLMTDSIIKPSRAENSYYSSNLAGFFIPVRAYTPLYGDIFSWLDSKITVGVRGVEIFAGFPSMIFAVVGLWKTRHRLILICALMALLFFVLSMGETLKVFGTDTGIPMPYALLAHIPPFDTNRTPVRFVVMGMFFLMILSASGISWIHRMITVRWGWRRGAVVMSLLFAWVVGEAYAPVQRQEAFVPPPELERVVAGPVLNIPPLPWDGYASLLQTFHHQPIATGYVARDSQQRREHMSLLLRFFDKGGAEFCEYVARLGVRNIIVTPDAMFHPQASSIVPSELSKCSINFIDLRKREATLSDSFGSLNPFGTGQPKTFPVYTPGTRIDFTTAEADAYLGYGWSGREPYFRWTDKGEAAIIFALNEIKTSVLRLKAAPHLVPGKLEEQRVEIELNGQPIMTLIMKEGGAKEYSVVLPENLLRDKNVLSFKLPDAESPSWLKIGEDMRLLGINVEWIEITPQPC